MANFPRLKGKEASIVFTAGSSGVNITSVEGHVIGMSMDEQDEDLTPLGADWEMSGASGRSWRITVRCSVNKGTGSNGNPQVPNNVDGTIQVYKNQADSSVSWSGACRVAHVRYSAQAGGSGDGGSQFADYTVVGQGYLAEKH